MAEPALVETLKLTSKSAVYRFVGAGLVAKRAVRDSAMVERAVYEHVLPGLPVPAIQLRGFHPAGVDDACWLILDDAGEIAYDEQAPAHRRIAARWLASIHVAGAATGLETLLPDGGPRRYLGHLRSTCAQIERYLGHPSLTRRDRRRLTEIVAQCGVLLARWGALERACNAVPPTVVHGDFVPKNMRVRTETDRGQLMVFDWEVTGWGAPAADLAECPDLATYWAAVQPAWSQVTLEELGRLVEVGRVFRLLAAMDWASGGLAESWVRRPMRCLRVYHTAMARALRRNLW